MSGTKKPTTRKAGKVEGNTATTKEKAEQEALAKAKVETEKKVIKLNNWWKRKVMGWALGMALGMALVLSVFLALSKYALNQMRGFGAQAFSSIVSKKSWCLWWTKSRMRLTEFLRRIMSQSTWCSSLLKRRSEYTTSRT